MAGLFLRKKRKKKYYPFKIISSRVSSESPEILQYESDNDQRRSRIRQEKKEKKARKKKKKEEKERGIARY